MVTQKEIMQHKDAGKAAGHAAEHLARKHGFGRYAQKIGNFVKKFVEKKQKAGAAVKADEPNSKTVDTTTAGGPAAPVTGAAPPAAPTATAAA